MTTANESTPTTPTTEQPPGKVRSAIRKYLDLVSNLTTAVWSVFLFAGGLVFIGYFASIGFMPEIDLKTSVTLLSVSAVTAGFLLILLSLSLLVPGLMWVNGTINHEKLKSLWYEGEKFSPWRECCGLACL